MAGYAQLTWHLSDNFDIIGGLRGTIDDRELKIFVISGAQGGSLGVGDYKATYKKLTYTGIATWRPKTASGRLTIRLDPWQRLTKADRAAIGEQSERLAVHRGVELTGVVDD